MLCHLCMGMFGRGRREGWHHRTISSLVLAAENNCQICAALLRDEGRRGEEPRIEVGLIYRFSEDGLGLQIKPHDGRDVHLAYFGRPFNIRLAEGDFSERKGGGFGLAASTESPNQLGQQEQDSRPWLVSDDGLNSSIPASTGHEGTAVLVKTWLADCLGTHPSCRAIKGLDELPFPARLIAVDREQPRLLLTEVEMPRGPYATLSHCWGKEPFLTLTADNLEEMRSAVMLSHLPKSFQDALTTIRRLGIDYLWIDSLCIIQSGEGSFEDWQKHSRCMGGIYAKGVLNISAARASSANEGFFAERNPLLTQPCHVRWRGLQQQEGKNSSKEQLYVIYQDPYSEIGDSPIAGRAWVLQERFFAPRILHFGDTQIFWECRAVPWACEEFPAGKPKAASVGSKWTPFTLMHGAESSDWKKILRDYSDRDLTRPDEDKFIALAGVAEHFASALGDKYIAGFFSRDLPRDLLWHVPKSFSRARKRPTATRYRAPSWSWASLDGRIQMSALLPDDRLLAQLVEARVDPVDKANPYGQVRAGQITLRGQLLRGHATIKEGSHIPEVELLRSGFPIRYWADDYRDFEEKIRKGELSSLQLLPIMVHRRAQAVLLDRDRVYGLLLSPLDREPGSYIRVGMWEWEKNWANQDLLRILEKDREADVIIF